MHPYDHEDDGPWLDLDEVEWEPAGDDEDGCFLQSAADESEFWALMNATWTSDEEHRIEDVLVRVFGSE